MNFTKTNLQKEYTRAKEILYCLQAFSKTFFFVAIDSAKLSVSEIDKINNSNRLGNTLVQRLDQN